MILAGEKVLNNFILSALDFPSLVAQLDFKY